MANKYGGIPVAEESTNRFGGIPVDAEPERRGDHVYQETKGGVAELAGMPMDAARGIALDRVNEQQQFAINNEIAALMDKGVSQENAKLIVAKKYQKKDVGNVFGIRPEGGGSKSFEDLLGYEKVAPRSGTEETLGGIGRFMGSGAPINIPMAVMRGGLKAGVKNLAANTSIDASAGMFGELGQSIGGTGGEITGQVAGGVIVPSVVSQRTALINAIRQGMKSGRDPQTMRPIAEAMVGKELSEIIPKQDNFVGALPEAEESLRRAQAYDRSRMEADSAALAEVNGLNPTLASQTGSDAAKALEAQAAGRSASDLAERNLKDEANRITLKQHATLKIPETADGEVVLRAERLKMNRRQQDIDNELSTLDQERVDLSQVDSVDQSAVGEVIKAERKVEKTALDAEKNRLYKEVSDLAESTGAQVNASKTLDLIKEGLASTKFKLDPANMPAVLSNTQRVIKQGGDISFNDATKILEEVTADIGDELVTGNRKRLRELYKIKKSIESELESFSKAGNKELTDSYGAARDFYRDVYAPKLLKGSNVKLSRITSLGEDRVLSENVVKEYFKPNGITGARRFKELYGDNRVAMGALEDGILDLYRKTVMRGDSINTPLHNSFMRRYESVLDEYPSVKKTLLKKDDALKAIEERQSTLITESKQISENIVMKHDESGKSFDNLIDEALGNKKKAFQLVYSVPKGNRGAVVVSMWERLYKRAEISGTEGMDGRKMLDMIEANEEGLEIAFRAAWGSKAGKSHMADLKSIANKSMLLERGVLKKGSGLNVPPSGFLNKLSMGLSQGRAVQTGRTGLAYAVGMTLGSIGIRVTKEQQHLIMKQMLYNPDLAKVIADAYRPVKNKKAFIKRMLGHVKPLLKAAGGVSYYEDFAGKLAPKTAASQTEKPE